jgi:penicillin-binding protein 1C
MSDRPEESRPSSEVAGGWFVPKNAMNEQEIAASSAQPADQTPMPDNTSPEKSGEWYVPPGSEARATEVSGSAQGEQAPRAEQKPSGGEKPASNLPQGAALSSEVDYSNYVPGKGFVPKSEAPAGPQSEQSQQQADDEPAQVTSAQPAADVPVETPPPSAPPQSAAVYTPGQPAPGAGQPGQQGTGPQSTGQQGTGQQGTGSQTPQPQATGQQAAVQQGTGQSAPKAANPELVQRYADVERAVQVLRRRYAAGSITRDQLQTELRKLMILDEDGYWWMIGLESDRWYKYNGKDWSPATPPGRPADAPAAGASSASPSVSGAPARPAIAGQAPAAGNQQAEGDQGRFDIPLDEYGMPLPQRVPINDLGATMVGASAPRLDNTLRSEPSTQAGQRRFFDRASQQGAGQGQGVAPYDGGVTMPNPALQLTQPGAAVRAGAGAPAVPGIPSPAGPAVPAPRPKAAWQPDYGEKPKSVLADRQRRAGCLIRLAIASVFGVLALSVIGIIALVLGYYSIIQNYDAGIANLAQAVHSASQSARILDKNGRVLYQLNDPNLGARIYVPLNQISPNVIGATVRVENKRFYEDPGFDVVAIVRAILQNLRAGEGVSGASSITQQLTRQFVLDPGAAQDRSSRRKITEIIVASELARRYTKSQIMEFYLNSVYYGNLAYGIEAASQTYFQKSAKDVNLAEAVFMAGLVQSPATYDPVLHRDAAMARFRDVLALMADLGCIRMEHPPYDQTPFCVDQGVLNQNAVNIARVQATTFRPPRTSAIYPHFVNYVQQQLEAKFGKDAIYSSGFNVYTTIDPKIQDIADQAVKDQIARLKGRNVTNGAVLALRPTDGAILAMVGSVDFNNKDIGGEFNVTLAARQPGSSIKPFVYAAALERDPNGGYWTPATVIWDVPSCFGPQQGGYCPRNYDSRFHGPQTMRYALANSYNIPAVKTLQYVTVDRFKQLAGRFGVSFPLTQPEQAGLALALGGVEIPLIDMVRGYSVFANNGKRVDSYAIAKVTRKNGNQEEVVFDATDHPAPQVIEPGIAYLITSILSDNAARTPAFGANSPLRLRDGRPAAVKTGTTNDSKDNWTIGYTPQLVVGVWVGNNNNTPMQGTSGVEGAAPIWNQVMTNALAGQPPMPFQPAPTDQQMRICADFGTQDFQECPTHAAEWYFQPNPPPPPDNIFRTLQIDSFSGLIANENCPDYVQNKTFLLVNDPTAIAWLNNDPAGQAWAKAHNLDLPVTPPPTQACDPNTPRPSLRVTSPQPNTTVQSLLEIRGSVFVPGFNRYQIEVGQGFNATQFQIVDGPITAQPQGENSFLGRWDTTGVPNGPYTIRLWAVDGQGHHAEVALPVNVNNVPPTEQGPQPQPTTVILPTQPGGIFPTQPGPGVEPTMTPIVIQQNQIPPTPTMRSIFPPTSTPKP